MSKNFLSLSVQDRKLAFDDAGLGLQMQPVILEKDFWVSWLLCLLFAQPELAPLQLKPLHGSPASPES